MRGEPVPLACLDIRSIQTCMSNWNLNFSILTVLRATPRSVGLLLVLHKEISPISAWVSGFELLLELPVDHSGQNY